MINIAFAGFRHAHILALYDAVKQSDLVQLRGAFEENVETRLQMEKEKGITFNYDTYEALLADTSVDAVAIGDYYSIRGSRVIEALKAGKHVISDKPLCTEESEAKEIRRLCEEKNLTAYLMLDLRFDPSFFTAKKTIESGAVGEIMQIAFQGQHPLLYNERARWYFEEGKHGGVINDIAIHGIDIVRYMCGLSPEKVLAAKEWNAYAKEAPHFLDSGVFMCEMEGGSVLTADVSYASPDGMRYSMPTYWEFRIWGTEGMLTFSRNLPELTLYKKDSDHPETIHPTPAPKTMLEDFLDCIAKKEGTILTAKDTLDSTDITLKIRKESDKCK